MRDNPSYRPGIQSGGLEYRKTLITWNKFSRGLLRWLGTGALGQWEAESWACSAPRWQLWERHSSLAQRSLRRQSRAYQRCMVEQDKTHTLTQERSSLSKKGNSHWEWLSLRKSRSQRLHKFNFWRFPRLKILGNLVWVHFRSLLWAESWTTNLLRFLQPEWFCNSTRQHHNIK